MTSKNPKNCQKNICETCEYICSYQSDYNRQLSTRKHKWKQMETNGNKWKQMETNLSQKVAQNIECKTCGYVCCRKNDYVKHLSTRKHKWKQMETNGNKFNEKNEKNRQMILTVSVVRVINTIVIIIDKKNVHIY